MDESNIPASIIRIIRESRALYEPRRIAILIGNASPAVLLEKSKEDVDQDLAALSGTFTELKFTVLVLPNFSESQIQQVVGSVSNFTKCGIAWPPSWKRLVVVYSGSLLKQSKAGISIEGIVDIFVNSVQEELMGIAKLFFLDYSRDTVFGMSPSLSQSNDDHILVARGESSDKGTGNGDGNATQNGTNGLTARGGSKVVARGQIPPGKNYLVASSTQKQMKSYLNSGSRGGSCWIQKLCEALVREDLIECDIEGVLKEVNISLIRKNISQQPEHISSLNEYVKLLKEAKEGKFKCLCCQFGDC